MAGKTKPGKKAVKRAKVRMKPLPAPQPWERQPAEGSKPFEGFRLYLDMGTDRTLQLAADKLGKARSTLERWSMVWSWKDRIMAWERYEWAASRKKKVEETAEMNERHAKIGKLILNRVIMRLQGTEADQAIAIDPSKISATQIAKWAVAGSKIERLARGEATELFGSASPRDDKGLSDTAVEKIKNDILGVDTEP